MPDLYMVYTIFFFLLLGLNRENIKYKKTSTNITNYCLSFLYKFVLLVRVGYDWMKLDHGR